MTIEHRCYARHRVELSVYIRYRKRRFSGAACTDVSDRGMFLQVRNLTMPIGTMVELELPALGRDWRIPAIVSHHAPTGIGVMFREPWPDLLDALSHIATDVRQPSAARLRADQRPGVLR